MSAEKSLNKYQKQQQAATTTNSGEGWESDFQKCHTIIFKMSSFDEKLRSNEKILK